MRLLNVTSLSEALGLAASSFCPLPEELVSLDTAGGCILARDLCAPEDVPSFDRSTVDGYAVKSAETFGASDSLPAFFDRLASVEMGKPAGAIAAGECSYVPTGGMLPEGADGVVMVEYSEVAGTTVQLFRQTAPGDNIIRRGEDIAKGQVILEKGRKLRSPELGMLASLGIPSVRVTKKPVVGVFSTGDEIVPWNTQQLSSGSIRDTNSLSLGYLACQYGAEVVQGGILPDTYEAFCQGVADMADRTDMVVLSGGSSVGERDFTPHAFKELCDTMLFEGLAIQPGKPTLLGKLGNTPLFGLPGHPVSALNVFALVGRTLLYRLGGSQQPLWQPSVRAVLMRNVPSRPGRTDLVRVKLAVEGTKCQAHPVFGCSGLLRTLADAHGVIEVPEAADGLHAGTEVAVFLWD